MTEHEKLTVALGCLTRLASATDAAVDALCSTRLEDLALKPDDARIARDLLKSVATTMARNTPLDWGKLRAAAAALAEVDETPGPTHAHREQAPTYLSARMAVPASPRALGAAGEASHSAHAPYAVQIQPPGTSASNLAPSFAMAETAPMQGPPPSTAALPFQGEPRLSLERYASIYGTLQRTPNARPHVLQRLGWTEQELQAEELAWRSHLQKRPGLLGAFLQAAGRPEPGRSPGDSSR